MNAKLDKICELSKFLCEKESLGQRIVSVVLEFRLNSLMQAAGITKEQGVPCSILLLYLLLIRILEISVFRFYKEKWYGLLSEGVGKNCFYRFLTNASYNWRSLLLGVAKQFLRKRPAIILRVLAACMTIPAASTFLATRCLP